MANSKISALAAASALDGTEVFPLVQSSATKKATVGAFGGASLSQAGAARLLYSFDPASIDANAGKFNLGVSTSAGINLPGSAHNDTVWYFGYNIDNAGARQDATKPALSLNWESEYWQGGVAPAAMEFHLNFVDTAGGNHRPITFFLPFTGGAGSIGGFTVDKLNLYAFDGTQKMLFDWSAGTISLFAATPFQFGVNNYAATKQMNAAGNAYISLPYITNLNQMQISAATVLSAATVGGVAFQINASTTVAGDALIYVAGQAMTTGDLYGVSLQTSVSSGHVLRNELRNTGTGKASLQVIANGSGGDAIIGTEAGTDWSAGTQKSSGNYIIGRGDTTFADPVLTLNNSSGLATFIAGLSAAGSLTFSAAASGLVLKQGANGRCGTFVANGASQVTVSNTSVAVTDIITFSLNTVGGVVGAHPVIDTITAGVGFTIKATAADTSTYNYSIVKNAA